MRLLVPKVRHQCEVLVHRVLEPSLVDVWGHDGGRLAGSTQKSGRLDQGLQLFVPCVHPDVVDDSVCIENIYICVLHVCVMGNMQNVVYGRPLSVITTAEALLNVPRRK